MRVLVLTTVLPGGERTGGEIVTQGVVDGLRRAGWDVEVLGHARPGEGGSLRPGEVCAGRRPIETSEAGWRAGAWMAKAVAGGDAYSVAKYRSRGYRQAVRDATVEPPDGVIIDHVQPHFALRELPRRGIPLVFLAHNAEGDMYSELASEAHGRRRRWSYAREARLIRRAEAELARRARQVWALSAEDAASLRELAPGADVRVFDAASRAAPSGAGEPECDVAVIGNWSWHANALGLEWFSERVVPRLPRHVSVDVAGVGSDRLRGRPGVRVRGRVPDAHQFLARSRVVAVPAVSGRGVQIKTLDAIASGTPVVSTSIGVRGLSDLPASVAVADDPEEFAEQLERLAEDDGAHRAEALAWSEERRERLDSAVADLMSEVTGRERSTARLG